jgi:hypothetical protein
VVLCAAAQTSNWLEEMLEEDRSGNRAHFAEVPFFQGISAGISPHSVMMLKRLLHDFRRLLSPFA